MNDFSERVFQVVREIPRGKVTNYGFVAFAAGNPRASRGVGFVLHRNRHGRPSFPQRKRLLHFWQRRKKKNSKTLRE